MTAFLRRFAPLVFGLLSGFDRLVFRGCLRKLAYPAGLQHYLWANRIPFKEFHAHSEAVTARLIEASQQQAVASGREIRYLPCSSACKEDIARAIAARDGIRDGLICILRSVEPCMSLQINKSQHRGRLESHYRQRQCLHLYHYQIHPFFGFRPARIQTWFPFAIQICLNGREWLGRQLDQAGIAYRRYDNSFPWVADLERAQALLDEQTRAAWPQLLGEWARQVNPLHDQLFARYPSPYYWSLHQSEWATDVLFHRREDLDRLYPLLVRHGITTYGTGEVMRFLGRQRLSGSSEVVSDTKVCRDGVRLKHRFQNNSVKMYDKDSILRVELTMNDPRDCRVYRPREGDPEGEKAWRPLRKGVADVPRRAEVSQAATGRYLEAAAAVTDQTPRRQLAEPLCRPVPAPGPAAAAASPGTPPRPVRRVRALNPLTPGDAALLTAVSRPEFLQNGLRNRDICRLLFPQATTDAAEQRRRSGVVTRALRLLRAHGLLKKVPKTHRYQVTSSGRVTITALLAARSASTEALTANAA